MRRLAQTLIFLLSISFLSGLAFAQTRGEGVGPLWSNAQGDTIIATTDVRPALWSELIVESGAEEIQAVAKLDEKGRVNFTFEAESADVGNLYIYAVDEAGITNKILITGTSLSDEVLPPTLVSRDEEELPEDSIKLTGFSYPGTVISVVLTSDRGYSQTLSAIADTTSGYCRISADSLVSGNYTVKATADLFGKISQESQALTFELPSSGLIDDIIKLVGLLTAP